MIAHLSPFTASRRLVDSFVFRAVADAIFRARARSAIARFDRLEVVRCQRRILLGLVHAAQATAFGRDHDFRRIRTEADFRRLVPLRTPAALRRVGAAAMDARLLQQARRDAWTTALAFVATVRPEARLLSGRLALADAADVIPALVQPYALTGEVAADRLIAEPITCLAGSAQAIASWIDHARYCTGRDRISDIWPRLKAVLYNGKGPAGDAAPQLRQALGSDVLLLETRISPDGPVAVEDPRGGGLRLLFDHGVYFEFTPAAEGGTPEAVRLALADVEPDVVYEMAMTSPAGLWGCRTGMAVRFERRDPPLFQIVEMPVACSSPVPGPTRRVVVDGKTVLTHSLCPSPAPHRQSAGIPAAPPEKLVHTPWSAPADRG
ncbi:MAG TPA: GH3 auxin-responsive promoter family protein [Gemmataceae bacterium]|nr:GH3 auxin-responsive promoter family protein [Gemmataceae bacterium]